MKIGGPKATDRVIRVFEALEPGHRSDHFACGSRRGLGGLRGLGGFGGLAGSGLGDGLLRHGHGVVPRFRDLQSANGAWARATDSRRPSSRPSCRRSLELADAAGEQGSLSDAHSGFHLACGGNRGLG